MKRPNWGITLLLIVVLISIFTNPSVEDHKQAVKTVINQFAQESLSEDDNMQNLGVLLGSSLAQNLIENSITRDNYLVFSITKATWKGETKSIGYGVFGNVFLSEKIKESLDRQQSEPYMETEVEVPQEL